MGKNKKVYLLIGINQARRDATIKVYSNFKKAVKKLQKYIKLQRYIELEPWQLNKKYILSEKFEYGDMKYHISRFKIR